MVTALVKWSRVASPTAGRCEVMCLPLVTPREGHSPRMSHLSLLMPLDAASSL